MATKTKERKANGKAEAETHDDVVKEYPMIEDRYRVRVIAGRKGRTALDIREYVKSDTYEGFTRKGIRIRSQKSIEQLLKALGGIELVEKTEKE